MKKLLLFLLIVNCQLSTVHSFAQTNVSGFINANTTWTVAGSPYIVVGNALVSQGYTLTIDPGVVVKFDTMKALQIDGTLIAIGTPANRITFTSSSASPVRGSWAKIHFSAYATNAVYDVNGNYQSGCIMKYCDVMYGGGLGYGEVHIESCKPYLSQCNIRYSNAAGIYCSGATHILDSSLVSDNSGYGLYFDQFSQFSCGLIVNGDTIRNNSNGGIFLGVSSTNCSTEIKNCSISSNSIRGAINVEGTMSKLNFNNNYIFNNSATFAGIITFRTPNSISNLKIENNYFNNNNAEFGTIFINDNISNLNINKNDFVGNTAIQGTIWINSAVNGDTISCNNFINNQGGDAVIYLNQANGPVAGIITYNAFQGNISNTGTKIAILNIWQNAGILNFSFNTIRSNVSISGKICAIKANLNNNYQQLKFHHNEFINNNAKKVVFISGDQINNSTLDFAYLKHNNFFDVSTEYSIYDSIPYGSPNLHADSNYWSSTNTVHIDSIIFDYFDFANQSVVYYSPILQTKEDIDTMCPGSIITFIEKPKLVSDNLFSIYPNPAHSSFTISFSGQLSVNSGQLDIYDIEGRKVYEQSFNHSQLLTFNLQLTPGVYFVKIQGAESGVQKLVIQ